MSQDRKLVKTRFTLKLCLDSLFFARLFYYSTYFFYYSLSHYTFLYYLLVSLYYFNYLLPLSTILSAKSFKFQQNKWIPNRPYMCVLFMGLTALFGTIYRFYCTILANFYLYLQYFQQKVFNFSKISGSQCVVLTRLKDKEESKNKIF